MGGRRGEGRMKEGKIDRIKPATTDHNSTNSRVRECVCACFCVHATGREGRGGGRRRGIDGKKKRKVYNEEKNLFF